MEGVPFEIRLIESQDIIFFTFKIGNLDWIDAPYNPHLSKNLNSIPIPDDNQGLTLIIFLVDSNTGEIKNIRSLVLSENYTRKLFDLLLEEKAEKFDEEEYERKINQIFSRYSSDVLATMSSIYCRINLC